MGKVSAAATMSLDGFIAGPNDTGFDLLFKWYGAGDVEVPMPDSTAGVPASRVAPATAELMRREQASWGALVVGRHLYDLTNAWNGRHPLGVTTVVADRVRGPHPRHPGERRDAPSIPRPQVATRSAEERLPDEPTLGRTRRHREERRANVPDVVVELVRREGPLQGDELRR